MVKCITHQKCCDGRKNYLFHEGNFWSISSFSFSVVQACEDTKFQSIVILLQFWWYYVIFIHTRNYHVDPRRTYFMLWTYQYVSVAADGMSQFNLNQGTLSFLLPGPVLKGSLGEPGKQAPMLVQVNAHAIFLNTSHRNTVQWLFAEISERLSIHFKINLSFIQTKVCNLFLVLPVKRQHIKLAHGLETSLLFKQMQTLFSSYVALL